MLKLLVLGCIILSLPMTVLGCLQRNPNEGGYHTDQSSVDYTADITVDSVADTMVSNSDTGVNNDTDIKGETDMTDTKITKAEYRRISAEEAKEMIANNSDAIILDVRTVEEFNEGYIGGAVLLPDYEVSEKAADVLTDKDEMILIYCRSGNRSRSAAYMLIDMGYMNVYDFGGINAWPYDIVKD